jgi:hypothetical protein
MLKRWLDCSLEHYAEVVMRLFVHAAVPTYQPSRLPDPLSNQRSFLSRFFFFAFYTNN